MEYRSEIDGLRAVAVIPVILFHAGFEFFSGGFVGVDVFFVISGYLITTIILADMEQGRFSLIQFYERRARRILPALFLVMLVSLPFAWLWLWPSDTKSFSRSLVAVSTFSSNILFSRESGYWDVASELKPLLHTWSLAVEEQYYLLFPLFLMMMWRLRKRWILGSLMVITVASLVASQWQVKTNPSANFFLITTRGWELAIGAMIAFYFLYRKHLLSTIIFHRHVNEALGFLGLLMIGYSVYAFDESVPFPSFYTLVPTIGTGLIIIFASSQTFVGQLLGKKLLVGIGLISYSAYLWHHVLFSFARHRSLTELTEPLLVVLACLSFPLAYLSWKYVEQPFRNKERVSRKAVFAFALTGSMSFIGIGLTGQITDGFDSRSNINGLTSLSIEKKLKVNFGLSRTCDRSFTLSPDCRTSNEPELLVWGDSFAMHLLQGILASNPDAKIIQLTKSGCGPFFDVAPLGPKHGVSGAEDCLEFTEKVREWLKANNTVKYAVVSSPFNAYLSRKSALLFRNGDQTGANADLATVEFLNTLNELQAMGITPVVFGPPPAIGYNFGRCLARASWLGLNLDMCNFQVKDIPPRKMAVYAFLEHIQSQHRVVRLDHVICDNEQCMTHIDSTFIFRDIMHLSHEGSAKIGTVSGFYQLIVDGHSN